MEGFYSKRNPKKKLTIIANKFNNHSSIQQSKHYKLQNKTTKKYTHTHTHTQNININIYIYIYMPKKKKPNENWIVKHNLQELRFIEKGIWKASFKKKKKKHKKIN